MRLVKLAVFGSLALMLLEGGSAVARNDVAPTPRRSPRTPVQREKLAERNKIDLPPSRVVTGTASVIDTERLKIGDVEMRLFGVVPPQLSATFGPQARAVLDSLSATGAVSCAIRDRERDGRFLATCRNVAGADLALELLRRGLAVAARGSLRTTELNVSYLATEQAAQGQRLGLWSVTLPPAASEDSIRKVVEHNEAVAVAAAAAKEPPALEVHAANASPVPAQDAPKTAPKAGPKAEPIPVVVTVNGTPSQATADKTELETPKIDQILPYLMPLEEPEVPQAKVADMGFFERYQLLVTGLLMLLTSLGVIVAVLFQRWNDKREERRSVAAALRGELMAARAVCLARLNAAGAERGERNFSWPRIRTLVFQAYVGRIGYLGAVLSRQVASIYGQAADYFTYYNAGHGNAAASKRKALKTLVSHIEEVLPKLATIEESRLINIRPTITAVTSRLPSLPTPPLRLAKPSPKVETGPELHEEAYRGENQDDDSDQEIEATDPAPAAKQAKPASGQGMKHGRLWDAIRKFAAERLETPETNSMEDHFPDYASLSDDEELEAMIYDEGLDDVFEEKTTGNKPRQNKTG
jgi:endonuclease YncB( thermonuclease family)